MGVYGREEHGLTKLILLATVSPSHKHTGKKGNLQVSQILFSCFFSQHSPIQKLKLKKKRDGELYTTSIHHLSPSWMQAAATGTALLNLSVQPWFLQIIDPFPTCHGVADRACASFPSPNHHLASDPFIILSFLQEEMNISHGTSPTSMRSPSLSS